MVCSHTGSLNLAFRILAFYFLPNVSNNGANAAFDIHRRNMDEKSLQPKQTRFFVHLICFVYKTYICFIKPDQPLTDLNQQIT